MSAACASNSVAARGRCGLEALRGCVAKHELDRIVDGLSEEPNDRAALSRAIGRKAG